jgi:hypothetical protein
VNITQGLARKLVEIADGKRQGVLMEDVLETLDARQYPLRLGNSDQLSGGLLFDGKPLNIAPLYCTLPDLTLWSHTDVRKAIANGSLIYDKVSSPAVAMPSQKQESWRDRQPLL